MENFEEQQHLKIEGAPGQYINYFAEQLVDAASKKSAEVEGTFNGIDLIASPDSTVKGLIQNFHKEREKRAEKYRESPEGIQAAKEAEERKQKMQKKADQLIKKLESLNFADYESVLEWLCDFQEASDHIDVSFGKAQVISTFNDHGFDIGVNTGDDFDRDNAENFAKYLVGQALNGINTVGAPGRIVHKFTNDWKQKFGRQQEEDQKTIDELKKNL